jgi:uncharacterized protein YbcI
MLRGVTWATPVRDRATSGSSVLFMGGETQPIEDGHALLGRLSTEMVRAQKEYFGKGPTSAKSYFLDDMLIIVMKGGMTTAEETMLDFGEHDKVRDFRQTFENRMTEKLTSLIEELTGRKVLTYQSQVMFEPNRVVEMFVFDDLARREFIEATAHGQLRNEPVGEVRGDDTGVDAPS